MCDFSRIIYIFVLIGVISSQSKRRGLNCPDGYTEVIVTGVRQGYSVTIQPNSGGVTPGNIWQDEGVKLKKKDVISIAPESSNVTFLLQELTFGFNRVRSVVILLRGANGKTIRRKVPLRSGRRRYMVQTFFPTQKDKTQTLEALSLELNFKRSTTSFGLIRLELCEKADKSRCRQQNETEVSIKDMNITISPNTFQNNPADFFTDKGLDLTCKDEITIASKTAGRVFRLPNLQFTVTGAKSLSVTFRVGQGENRRETQIIIPLNHRGSDVDLAKALANQEVAGSSFSMKDTLVHEFVISFTSFRNDRVSTRINDPKASSACVQKEELGCGKHPADKYMKSTAKGDFQIGSTKLGENINNAKLGNPANKAKLLKSDNFYFMPDGFDGPFRLIRIVLTVKNANDVTISLESTFGKNTISSNQGFFQPNPLTIKDENIHKTATSLDQENAGASGVDYIKVSYSAKSDVLVSQLAVDACTGGEKRCASKKIKTSSKISSSNNDPDAGKAAKSSGPKYVLPKTRKKVKLIVQALQSDTFTVQAIEFAVEGKTTLTVMFKNNGNIIPPVIKRRVNGRKFFFFSDITGEFPPGGVKDITSIEISLSRGGAISGLYVQSCISKIDCMWGTWSEWSDSCTKRCHRATQFRTRQITKAEFGGKPCKGVFVQERPCDRSCKKCPGGKTKKRGCDCPNTCLSLAFPNSCVKPTVCRTRCVCPPGFVENFDGSCVLPSKCSCIDIDGEIYEHGTTFVSQDRCAKCLCEEGVISCTAFPDCDCRWGPWGEWSDCNRKCGSGVRKRFRFIASPRRGNGKPCDKNDRMTQPCNQGVCPVCFINGKQFRHPDVISEDDCTLCICNQDGKRECHNINNEGVVGLCLSYRCVNGAKKIINERENCSKCPEDYIASPIPENCCRCECFARNDCLIGIKSKLQSSFKKFKGTNCVLANPVMVNSCKLGACSSNDPFTIAMIKEDGKEIITKKAYQCTCCTSHGESRQITVKNGVVIDDEVMNMTRFKQCFCLHCES